MKNTTRRININLTEKEDNAMKTIKEHYNSLGKKTSYMESQIIRDAINFYASDFANSGKDIHGKN